MEEAAPSSAPQPTPMLIGIPSAATTPLEPFADAAAPPSFFVFMLYYVPLLFALTVFVLMTEFRFSEMTVGAVAMFGTALPALGLIVGSVHLRADFLKGFFVHAVVGLLVAVLFFVLSAWFNLFGDIMDGTVRMVVLSMLPTLFAPVRYHLKQQHRRALGAAHAAPLAFMLVFFGLLFAWLSVYDAG
tara:strand:- start:833 stop:1393 length:561 start_codon:yes stop_codon:yes gene_type:complete